MRDLALPLSILVLAGVLALDHLPTAHAEEVPATALCSMIDRKGLPKNIAEEVQNGLAPHVGREVVMVPVTASGGTFGFLACSWEEAD